MYTRAERDELNFIFSQQIAKKMPPIPWSQLIKSAPLWAILVGHTTYNWGFYVLFTCLPKYLKEVLGFDMKHNALYSALPYLIMWISINVTTQVGDHLIATGKCKKVGSTILRQTKTKIYVQFV